MVSHLKSRLTSKSGFRVLVIDENEQNRADTLRALARSWPFHRELQVIWAHDTKDALARLREEPCTLVLLNRHTRDRDVATELRRLRDHGLRVPVVVVSDLASAELIAELKLLAAVHLPRQQMSKVTFHDAVGNSLRLLGRLPSDTQPIAVR